MGAHNLPCEWNVHSSPCFFHRPAESTLAILSVLVGVPVYVCFKGKTLINHPDRAEEEAFPAVHRLALDAGLFDPEGELQRRRSRFPRDRSRRSDTLLPRMRPLPAMLQRRSTRSPPRPEIVGRTRSPPVPPIRTQERAAPNTARRAPVTIHRYTLLSVKGQAAFPDVGITRRSSGSQSPMSQSCETTRVPGRSSNRILDGDRD